MLLMKKKLILLLDEVKKTKQFYLYPLMIGEIEPELNFFLNRLEKVSKNIQSKD